MVVPRFWTMERGEGFVSFRYAVRGGPLHVVLVLTGSALLLLGLYGVVWIAEGWFGPEGEFLVGSLLGVLFALAFAAAGFYMVNRMLFSSASYRLEPGQLKVEIRSLTGGRRDVVEKSQLVNVTQPYTPPGASSPRGSEGIWSTLLVYRTGEGKERSLALEGLGSSAEARLFGPLLAKWGGVDLKREFSAGFEEVPAEELPLP